LELRPKLLTSLAQNLIYNILIVIKFLGGRELLAINPDRPPPSAQVPAGAAQHPHRVEPGQQQGTAEAVLPPQAFASREEVLPQPAPAG
jgi:hypothetical protein